MTVLVAVEVAVGMLGMLEVEGGEGGDTRVASTGKMIKAKSP